MTIVTSYIPPEVSEGTTTSWLPVTTAYPSVSGCDDAYFLYPNQVNPVAWDPGYGYFASGTLRCLPPEATSWWELPHQNPDGYTSLSIRPIVCPAAYTTAATEVRSESSTLVMCCPSDYALKDGQPGRVTGFCESPLHSGQIIPYTARADNGSWISTTWTISAATSIRGIEMRGWNVADAVTATSTTTSSGTAQATLPSSTSTGLSTGAKAGIGVGVSVAALVLIGLLFFFLRRHGKRRMQKSTVGELPAATSSAMLDIKPPERPDGTPPVMLEKSGGAVYEMRQSHNPAVELWGTPEYNTASRVELR